MIPECSRKTQVCLECGKSMTRRYLCPVCKRLMCGDCLDEHVCSQVEGT